MRVGLALAILLSVLRWPLNLQPLCVAGGQPTPQTTGLTVQYTLIIANSPDCELSLVDNFPVRVQYRTIIIGGDGESVSQWMDSPRMPGSYMYLHYTDLSIDCVQTGIVLTTGCDAILTSSAGNLPVHVTVRSYSLQLPNDVNHINASQRVQLRLVQSDHRGGFCDCWAVSNLTVSNLEATSM